MNETPNTPIAIDVDLNTDIFVAKLDSEGTRALLLMKQSQELGIYIEPQLSDGIAVLTQMKAIIDVAIAELQRAGAYDLHALPTADTKPN